MCSTIFPDFCVFQDLFSGRVLGIGKEDQGLYLLNTDIQPRTLKDKITRNSCISFTSVCSLHSLWHKRLGHAPFTVLSRIQCLQNVPMKDHNCTVCPIAKQTRLPFPTSVSLSNACFDIVHVDVWGPY